MAFTSPSFLVDCCMFWAALGDLTWKMVSILWQFCVKICEIARTHDVFTLKCTLCLLHSVRIKGVRDRSWQGQKWPCFSCLCIEIWIFTHSMNSGENGCFSKGSGFCVIWGLRHLAMIVARGVALSELTEQRCSVSCFELGLVIRLSPWSSAFFCTALFSLCRAMRVHKKIRRCSRIS